MGWNEFYKDEQMEIAKLEGGMPGTLWGWDDYRKSRLKMIRLRKIRLQVLRILRKNNVSYREAYIILDTAKDILAKRNSREKI